jgi:excisionase family DNA binding protein
MPVPEYLTLQEAATLLRIGERTAYTRCRSGQFPGAAKVGGRWRVDRVVLERWLRRGGDAPSKTPRRPEERK